MKYQEALNRIAKYCGVNNDSMLEDDLKTLQELVDKATPKKTNKIIDDFCDDTYEYCFCSNCENQVIENLAYYTEWENDTTLRIVYCPSCGQALKWSE